MLVNGKIRIEQFDTTKYEAAFTAAAPSLILLQRQIKMNRNINAATNMLTPIMIIVVVVRLGRFTLTMLETFTPAPYRMKNNPTSSMASTIRISDIHRKHSVQQRSTHMYTMASTKVTPIAASSST